MAILGLIVLLICVLLFTPLRYRIQARCMGKLSTLDAGADFSLFFHLISGQVRYRNEELHWKVRIAWKRLGSEAAERVEEAAEDVVDVAGEVSQSRIEVQAVVPQEQTEQTIEKIQPPQSNSSSASPEKRTEQKAVEVRKAELKPGEQKEKEDKKEKEEKEEKKAPSQKPKKESAGFGEKIEHVFEKIKYTFQQFCAKIKELLRKKDILMEFIKNESHQAALFKALKELKRLILRLKPKKFSADIHYGFEDPGLTGLALAGISMVYPALGEQVDIRPDFEHKILEGSLFIKGHVRARIFAALAWNLILNKNVRILIRDIKNFSFDA